MASRIREFLLERGFAFPLGIAHRRDEPASSDDSGCGSPGGGLPDCGHRRSEPFRQRPGYGGIPWTRSQPAYIGGQDPTGTDYEHGDTGLRSLLVEGAHATIRAAEMTETGKMKDGKLRAWVLELKKTQGDSEQGGGSSCEQDGAHVLGDLDEGHDLHGGRMRGSGERRSAHSPCSVEVESPMTKHSGQKHPKKQSVILPPARLLQGLWWSVQKREFREASCLGYKVDKIGPKTDRPLFLVFKGKRKGY